MEDTTNTVGSEILPTPSLLQCDYCEDEGEVMYENYSRILHCEPCMKALVQDKVDKEVQEQLALYGNVDAYLREDLTQYFMLEYRKKELIKPLKDYSNEPQVSGFMIVHTRATDRVYFGPFKTVEEIYEWMEKVGVPHHVSGSIYPLMNPQGDPEDFWYIPNDMPWEELIRTKKERGYIP